MPKINYYNNKIGSSDVEFTRNADPSTWGWDYPVGIQQAGDYIIGTNAQQQDNFRLYGVFPKTDGKILDDNQVLSAMEIEEMPGASFDIPEIQKVAVIHNAATIEHQRGKGFIRLLYEFILNKYKILFSDKELFTDKGKDSKTLGIWKKFLPTLGTVLNWNAMTHEYTAFNPDDASEDTRFVVVKDKNVAQKMVESFNKWVKHGVTGAAMTGLLSLPLISATNVKNDVDNVVPNPPKVERSYNDTNTTGRSPLAPPETKQEEPPEQKQPHINVNIIADLESGGNTHTGTNRKGASGLCQLKKAAWDEAAKSLFGSHGDTRYPYSKYAKNAAVNKQISDQYYNVVLPKHLEAFDLPITTETLLASYNWGSTKVKHAIQQYGDHWLRAAPAETRSYVERYKNLENNL